MVRAVRALAEVQGQFGVAEVNHLERDNVEGDARGAHSRCSCGLARCFVARRERHTRSGWRAYQVLAGALVDMCCPGGG
ncbi:hypothetical protein STIAU_1260 [Stigmatella aurantiaca DW4/3-1]|uniref:Uncharacterized protein n=1 Tax=Stigmatella aurantiaca (strain DW4/3-1) TaxID=378806 RepID=Q08SX9_STIAD|nr:hypothetical protein STIAU_1260 [Stigmatella aurantiaca DW4/3-1]